MLVMRSIWVRAIWRVVRPVLGQRHCQDRPTHIDRITGILENPADTQEREAFNAFANELRDDLNDSITDGEIIEC